MTVPTTIDANNWLSKYLTGEGGDHDLARAMLAAFAETLMSAQASMMCEAGYNERSEDRVNSRNGYRHRDFDTRVGTVDAAIPKLRHDSYWRCCVARSGWARDWRHDLIFSLGVRWLPVSS